MKTKMLFNQTTLLAAWLIAGGIGVSHADLVDIKWTDGAFVHKASIAPTKFLELCGKLKKDDSVEWRFNGSAPTNFNIHYHVGKDVVYPENRKEIAAAEGKLRVPLDQDFCWMWSNKSALPIDLEVSLTKSKPDK
ncbi:MAG: hypothetical protein JNN20_02730 [Betaproteobacteria bacterium]|nr:hypothetical protein [Betaproteobacteria bacterium]